MARREIKDRYVGQVLGLFWAVGHPFALMLIYIFIFSVVFKAKMGGTASMPYNFPAYLLSGLIPWLSFQESLNKSVTVIKSNSNLVKQVVFPIEILPVKGVLAGTITQIIASTLLAAYLLASYRFLPWTFFLVPALIAVQVLAMIGLSYVLSSVGVYFRDLKDFVQVFFQVGIFILPIVYDPKWVPSLFQPILVFNPLSHMIWCYQDACYFGRFEHPWSWVIFPLGSIAVFYTGYRVFRKLKLLFGNVL